MKIKIITIITFCLLLSFPSYGQDTISPMSVYPKSISFTYGIGNYTVRDYFFSDQKYIGNMPLISFEWMQPHDRYGYRMGLEFRKSEDIKNYTMPASITQFSLYQDFLYSLGNFRLFKKPVYAYLGPSLDFYFYYNQQQFAESGIYFDLSFVTLLSTATDAYFIMEINKRWMIESNLRLNLLSLGIQMPEVMVEEGKEAGTTIKFLSPLNGLRTNFDISGRFFIIKRLSLSLAYRLELTNINIRERVNTVSDNVIGTIAYNF